MARLLLILILFLPLFLQAQVPGIAQLSDMLVMSPDQIRPQLRSQGWKPISEPGDTAFFEEWEYRTEENDSLYLLIEWDGTHMIGINYELSDIDHYRRVQADLDALGFEVTGTDAMGNGRVVEYTGNGIGITLETTYTGRKKQKGKNWNNKKDWIYRFWIYRL